ncbi:hypothetical protein, partial [Mycobacteroides saopaulense]|uniref:hypothetical protein n=1 Tax=Mycobacteroides saopaulense TaxID=1578165 RepID=UPI0013F4BEA3
HLSDSVDDLAGRTKGQRLKQKPVNLFDDDDDVEAGLTKRRKIEENERNEQNTDFDSEAFVLTTKFSNNNQSGLCDIDNPDLDDSMSTSAGPSCHKDSEKMAAQDKAHNKHSNDGSVKDVSNFAAASVDGWLNAKMAKSEDNQNGDDGQDTKFYTESLK